MSRLLADCGAENVPENTPTKAPGNGAAAGVIEGLLAPEALDKRTRAYRLFAGVLAAIYSDCGGEARLTEVRKQLARRLASLAVWAEAQDVAALQGGAIDVDLYGRVAGHMRRIAEALGLERVPRDLTPDLHTYLAKRTAATPKVIEQ